MSELLKARTVMTKKLNVMVRKIEGITAFVLAGNDEYTPEEIYFVVAAADDSALAKVHADLNFLIREFLRPTDIQKNESEGRIILNYVFDNGIKAQVIICGEKNLPSFEWWVPYLDKNGAVLGFYPSSTRKKSDPTSEKPVFDDGFSDDFDDDFDEAPALAEQPSKPEPAAKPEPEPVPVPIPVPAPVQPQPVQPQPVPVLESEPDPSDKELWNYFYGRVNVAKHAISGGSVIYACETIGELRTLLIRLICETNGINEDYLHSIDLLPENHRAALLKTYPAKPENGPMISALAAELSIFEELMKKSSR